jgi:hypothetical protein
MVIRKEDVDKLTDKAAKELLKEIIDQLDELDCDDFFGTEGWRHMFGLED